MQRVVYCLKKWNYLMYFRYRADGILKKSCLKMFLKKEMELSFR